MRKKRDFSRYDKVCTRPRRFDVAPVGQPFVEEGSVKPAKHKKGTHTFTVVGMTMDPRYLHQSILLRCLPCKVRVGVDTCRLLTFSIDDPLEVVIAGLQSVIADQDKKDICHGEVLS